MSARAPFVPRPASRIDAATDQPPASRSPPPAGYESFRPTGLLSPDAHIPSGDSSHNVLDGSDGSSAHPSSAGFKPLNLSGLGKAKNGPQGPLSSRTSKPRSSHDSSVRSPKPFSSVQHKHLAAPRPSSPFFPNAGLNSMNVFRAPAPPQMLHPSGSDEMSSNKAHTVNSSEDSARRMADMPGRPPSAQASDTFRFMDPSLVSGHRAPRSSSHPSLASIHEVEEEHETNSPHKVQQMGPPMDPHSQGSYSGDYVEDFEDSGHAESPHFTQGMRRVSKRPERAPEEDEYEYGTGAKRYKMAPQDEYAMSFGGRTTPVRYSGGEFERTATPAQSAPVLPPPATRKVGGDEHKQALYRLLGQDLDICVEAHADAYEQARKKWSECSIEEWTQGADELATRFGKMLDFVKDNMSTKLSLYASLHTAIAGHRAVLTERDKTLSDARESLAREAAAVVGGMKTIGTAET
ncbi:hypothetical protein OH76DRAFT_135455 [Lentinus brumalis]|uniref:Extracellular mutant protein 11 C-terminal domain-containing protein n=1 Tax=Lentinus brumalis TaxID=2498619 RepID=A0A371CPR8_9APHY|nr:hypothetical protein OH76DRAFT_135455 [Polyporus brumalis]